MKGNRKNWKDNRTMDNKEQEYEFENESESMNDYDLENESEFDDTEYPERRRRRRNYHNHDVILAQEKFIEDNDPLLNKSRHKNRRSMAWVSLVALVAMPLTLIFFIDPETASPYIQLVQAVSYAFVAVIMTYMGSTTWDSVNFRNVIQNRKK